MSIFESRDILKMNRDRGPKRLSDETLKALEVLMSKEMLPLDEEDVADGLDISELEVSEDLKEISNIKQSIKQNNELSVAIKEKYKELNDDNRKEVLDYYERLGHIFEGFLYTHISESKIFKDVILHKTSEFDDIKNGVDFVAEYQNPDDPKSYIALAMDASFSMSPSLINKKIDRSISDINKGTLSRVKYFQFEEGAPESKTGMPRVVVGAEEDKVRNLLTRWHTKETIKTEVDFSEDPVWTLMALQINEQLKVFIDQARSRNNISLADICFKYQRALDVSLRFNKDLVDKHRGLMDQDGTSRAILSSCENLRKYQFDLNRDAA